MSKIYNEEVKNRYLQTYDNEGTQNTIRNIFIKSYETENTLQKDLYNFSLENLIDVFKNINAKSKLVTTSAGRFIKTYISWCITQGYRDDNLNPLTGIENEWFSKWVNKKLKIHYTYEEFLDLLEQMNNEQDQAFLFCLWEGISGNQFSEIRKITTNDINSSENKIYIKERDQMIDVSEECIKYIEKALKQKTYYTFNHETKEYKEKQLLESKFIFKNVKAGRTEPFNPVSMTVLYNRLYSLKLEFELEHLTGNSVRMSGMIWEAVKLYQRYGKLEYEQFEKIGKKYNYSMITNNGYTYYNTTLMKQFINQENIKKLYDIDIEM